MTETEELKLKSEMVQKMGAMIFFAEKALRSIALNHAEAARSGVTEALNALNGILPNSAPPAELSGNTGELPVCATCGGTGVICDIHGRDDIYQEDDSYEQRCMICVGDERSGELVACPDCSASGSLPDQEGKKREK